ncbi:MAG: LysR substrate-binding domain-containing protein [Parvibaculaceae bacterium]
MPAQITRSRLPLKALRAFEAAARHRNLLRAADELAVTHGAVSHQIRNLERELKAPLFDRRRRPILLTQAGEQLLAAVHDSFDRLTRVASAIQNGEIEGEITLSCVPGLAANWLVPRLGRFLSLHANVAVHVVTEYWRHPKIADQADLAIAYGSAEHPGRRVVRLGHAEFFPVCSPALRRRRPPLRQPCDIAGHTLLHEYTDEAWSRWLAASRLPGLKPARNVYFDGAHLSLEAARAGYGIALGDTATVRGDLADGRLVRLFERTVPAAFPYYLVAPPESEHPAAARALEKWLIDEFAGKPQRMIRKSGRRLSEKIMCK